MNTKATYVNSSDDIPYDDLAKIKQRLMNQINSMSDADLRIAAKSEASLRYFIEDLFRTISQLFGYIVGSVTGIFESIGSGVKKGWLDGFRAGRGG
jgi:hypothetical protein